jgi:hypothetical protein
MNDVYDLIVVSIAACFLVSILFGTIVVLFERSLAKKNKELYAEECRQHLLRRERNDSYFN